MSNMNRMNATMISVEPATVTEDHVAAVVAVAPVVAAHVAVAHVNTFINTTNLVCRQTSEVDLPLPLTRYTVQACPRKLVPAPEPCSPT